MIKEGAIWAPLCILLLLFTFGALAQEPAQTPPTENKTPAQQEPIIKKLVKPEIFQLEKPEQPANISSQELDIKDAEQKLSERELALIDQSLNSEIELNFNNASLQNIVDQISQLFNLTFIPDDVVKTPESNRALSESKISFTTNHPLTKKRAWSLFTTFLELANWSLASTPDARIYRITAIENANHSPLPTYINTSLDILPKTNQRIRYVCFLENSTPDLMEPLLTKLKSKNGQIEKFALLRAIILTDAAYNVYSLLQIIRELDKTSSSQTLSVINLKEADASEVEALIKTLQSKDDPSAAPWMPKKESTLFYFSKEVSVISSPRTNSLIIIGPKAGVTRIEQFILMHIDTQLTQRYEPVHVYELNYAPAKQIATILNNVISFGKNTSSGGGDPKSQSVTETGGVLGGLKFFGNVYIEPEEQNNRLIIRSSEEDFQHLKKIISELDQRQLQVAIEVMIVEIDLNRTRQWGIQWDTKKNRSVNAQLSGFWGEAGPQTTSTPNQPSTWSNSIIANLISLAKYPTAGTTILTLGKDSIYAIMGILEADEQTRVIANPFIVATNKYRASVAIAQERRAKMQEAGAVFGEGGFVAKWEVSITPQINDEGIINLDIEVVLEDFTQDVSTSDPTNPANANKSTTHIQTNTNVANKEVIALGGLIRKKKTVQETRFPVLSKIPIIGNLFKNSYHKNEQKTLVILMSPTIMYSTDETIDTYTKNKAESVSLVAEFATERQERNRRDPIYNWSFKAADDNSDQEIRNFVNRGSKTTTNQTPLKSEAANTIINSALQTDEGEK